LDLTKRYEEAPPLFPVADDPIQPAESVEADDDPEGRALDPEPEGDGDPEDPFPEDAEEEGTVPAQAAE
jgi:hypothetical protein